LLRSHSAGTLRSSDIGGRVKLAGWVARRRDHGGVAFIDLRDYSGSVQVVISDEKVAAALRAEWCVLIEGVVTNARVEMKIRRCLLVRLKSIARALKY